MRIEEGKKDFTSDHKMLRDVNLMPARIALKSGGRREKRTGTNETTCGIKEKKIL